MTQVIPAASLVPATDARTKLTRLLVVRRRSLHLHGVVAVAELGEAEAADVVQRVDAL